MDWTDIAITVLALVVFLVVVPIVFDRALTSWMSTRVRSRIFVDPERVRGVRVALVLGCPPVQRDGRPNRYLSERVAAARALIDAECVERLRLSGIGREGGAAGDEIDAMRDALLDDGVPADRIEIDAGARRTIDSIRNAARDLPGERILLVSQPFHLMRALLLADASGLPGAIGFAAGALRPARGECEALRERLARWRSALDALLLRIGP